MNVVFLIPTLNEEKSIGKVIGKVKKLNIPCRILVVDGHSEDRTAEIAKNLGADVIFQKEKGKGAALSEAVSLLSKEDIVVLVDADNTYDLQIAQKAIRLADDKTIIYGKRIITKNAMTPLNRLGNVFFNGLVAFLFGQFIGDMLTGLRIFKVCTFQNLNLKAKNFEIETEMTLKSLKAGIRIIELPVMYREREGNTKLRPFRDGLKILKRIFYERIINK